MGTTPHSDIEDNYPLAYFWSCGNCIKYFGFIHGFVIPDPLYKNPCPCKQEGSNKEEIFLLLDEYTGNGPLDGGVE
jgi:hypothetical protein